MSIFGKSVVVKYYQRSIEICNKKGIIGFFKHSIKFIINQIDSKYSFRFRLYTFKNHLENYLLYDTPPSPYAKITIEPARIRFRLRRKNDKMVIPKVNHRGIGRIRDGDWDTHYKNIEDTCDTRGAIIKGFRQRYEEKKKWEETSYYKVGVSKYEKKSKRLGYSSVNDYVLDRIKSYEILYKEILKEGYIPGHKENSIRPGDSEPIESQLEVLVAIGRNGEIYLFGGYHRFSIARVLDLEIPVQVVCRHKKWQETRDEIYRNGLNKQYEKLHDHPDLQDLINN